MSNLFKSLDHALVYAKFRPIPPKQLIDSIMNYLSEKIPSKEWSKAVDVGCGSGQCTQLLSPYFRQVYGFDVSDAQISQAIHSNHSNHVFYKVRLFY
jgi:trans-aconitate methyltransferase